MFYDCKALTAVYVMAPSLTVSFYTQCLAHCHVVATMSVVTLQTAMACCCVTQRTLVYRHQHFEGNCCFHLQSRTVPYPEDGSNRFLLKSVLSKRHTSTTPRSDNTCNKLHYSYSKCSNSSSYCTCTCNLWVGVVTTVPAPPV